VQREHLPEKKCVLFDALAGAVGISFPCYVPWQCLRVACWDARFGLAVQRRRLCDSMVRSEESRIILHGARLVMRLIVAPSSAVRERRPRRHRRNVGWLCGVSLSFRSYSSSRAHKRSARSRTRSRTRSRARSHAHARAPCDDACFCGVVKCCEPVHACTPALSLFFKAKNKNQRRRCTVPLSIISST